MTNWGREPIITDLTPDEDSIQVVAYYQVCTEALNRAPNEEVPITYKIEHTQKTLFTPNWESEGQTDIKVTAQLKEAVSISNGKKLTQDKFVNKSNNDP